jgi:hypothetical protein
MDCRVSAFGRPGNDEDRVCTTLSTRHARAATRASIEKKISPRWMDCRVSAFGRPGNDEECHIGAPTFGLSLAAPRP